jgi:chromate transporter
VLRRRWVDDQSFLAMLAVGQVMPGSNGVKMTVLIGQQLRGPAGAAVALVALLAAPFAIVIAIGMFYVGLGEHRVVQAVLDGVAAAVIGLNLASGFGSMRGAPGAASWAIAGATILCVGVLRWPMLPVIAGLAPLSIGLALVPGRRR